MKINDLHKADPGNKRLGDGRFLAGQVPIHGATGTDSPVAAEVSRRILDAS